LILQIGAFFGNLLSGIGNVAGQVFSAALPSAVGIGQQFLQREVNRKLASRQRRQVGAQAVAALNTPGIAVARVGGTTQPVGCFQGTGASYDARGPRSTSTRRCSSGERTSQAARGSRRTSVR